MEINTYPEMDAKIKDILRIGSSQSGLYAEFGVRSAQNIAKDVCGFGK